MPSGGSVGWDLSPGGGGAARGEGRKGKEKWGALRADKEKKWGGGHVGEAPGAAPPWKRKRRLSRFAALDAMGNLQLLIPGGVGGSMRPVWVLGGTAGCSPHVHPGVLRLRIRDTKGSHKFGMARITPFSPHPFSLCGVGEAGEGTPFAGMLWARQPSPCTRSICKPVCMKHHKSAPGKGLGKAGWGGDVRRGKHVARGCFPAQENNPTPPVGLFFRSFLPQPPRSGFRGQGARRGGFGTRTGQLAAPTGCRVCTNP